MRKLGKILLILLLVVVLVAGGGLLYLTLTEYQPDSVESLTVTAGPRNNPAVLGKKITLVTMNTGYAGLGRDADFVLDGGTHSNPESKELVQENLNGILGALALQDADVYFLQEVDYNSTRSFGIDQTAWYRHGLSMGTAFARNYKCDWVPFPWPMIGRVESGLLTLNDFKVTQATRESLPVPFTWPLRIANLKRCLLVERVQLDGTDKELVIVNLHLKAYDDGEGKLAQTQKMMDILTEEYAKGNYVIAGGDWNQTFPGIDESVVPVLDSSSWMPGVLDAGSLPEGWRYAADGSAPSCRLLNMPYTDDSAVMQYYIIDGFLLSPNVQLVSIKTLDYGFSYSDHQPVLMNVKLVK